MALSKPDVGGILASNGGMVLVVEDDEQISRLERFVLEQVGYRVTCAGSGEEALELLPQAAPSLVILDVMLPNMDGFTTCQRIRETSQVPIIMVTARDEDDDKVRGLEMGADDYITKPFSKHELTSRVKSVLRRTSEGRTANPGPFQATSKKHLYFLHPRDESRSYPIQAPVTSDAIASDIDRPSRVSRDSVESPPAKDTNYEGAVKLVVETSRTVKELIRFIDFLRNNPQFHLLRMISNPQRDGMDVWVRLRGPNPLERTLLAVAGVSRVQAVQASQLEPEMPVLEVSID